MNQPPARLGRYEIVKRVGRGGMGTVYLARDPRLNRTVALKVLTDVANSEVHQRFLREARAAAALRHHHIVTVYDIGEDEGLPFIAMEYVEGETLGAFISHKPAVPAVRKLQIATELCTGLLFAHRVGIIHRDVKPGNIMLAEDGSVKILDFGLARWAADVSSAGLTQAGTLMGSPHYMSPEQVSAQVVDQRSDVFAVGAVLYELFTYQKAFPGDSTAAILHRILYTHPTPARALCPDLDPELESIVNRTVQKAPDNRYQTLQDLLQDLSRIRGRLTAVDDLTVWQPGAPAAEAQSAKDTTDLAGLDLIASQRAEQIQQYLKEAVDHFEREALEEASACCEQALLLDSQEPRATDLLRRVRERIEERQVAAITPSANQIERTRLLPPSTGERTSATRNAARWLWIAGIAVTAAVILVSVRQFYSREPARQSAASTNTGVAVTTEPSVPVVETAKPTASGDAAVANSAQLIGEAQKAYKAGRSGQAIDLALQALKLDPAAKDAAALLEQVRDDARRSTAAAREAAVRSGAEPTSTDFAAGMNAERLGDQTRDAPDTARAVDQYRVARERYQAAARISETTAKAAAARAAQVEALLVRADASIAARNFDEATRLVAEAQSHDPSDPRVRQAREKIQRAEDNWRAQQQEQETRDIQALLARADKLSDLSQRENALMDAQAKHPTSADIRAALARTREQMKRTPPAAPNTPAVDRREIVQAIKMYAAAYSSLSADAVRSVYPNVPARRQDTMEAQRKACRKLQVMFDESRIEPVSMPGGRVLVDVPLQYDCAQPTAGKRRPPFTVTEQMTLSRQADGRWLIDAMAER